MNKEKIEEFYDLIYTHCRKNEFKRFEVVELFYNLILAEAFLYGYTVQEFSDILDELKKTFINHPLRKNDE